MESEKQFEVNNNVLTPVSARPSPKMPENHYIGHVETVWIQAAHKYTIAFELIGHCLELCGMRKETVNLIILLKFCKRHRFDKKKNISTFSGAHSI